LYRCVREMVAERDRLREVLAGIVFLLGPVSSSREGRDPADGDGVIAYSYVPALVAAATAERNRLRAVVEQALNLGEDEGMRRGKTPYPDWWILLDHALDPRHPEDSAETDDG
jgi:hypothetical protein